MDDRSTDGTVKIVSEFLQLFPEKVFLYKTSVEKNGKKQALLVGIENANGDIIVTTDADCLHPENWLVKLTRPFADEKIKMATGAVVLNKPTTFFENIQQLDQTALTAISIGFMNNGLPVMCSGANLAFRKNAFIENGKYNSHLNEKSGDDVFLMHDFVKKYGKNAVISVSDLDSIVKTSAVGSVGKFLKQRLRWGEKSKRYRRFFPLFLAFVTAFSSALLLVGLLLLPVYHAHFTLLSISLGAKAAIDFLLLFLTGRVLGTSASLWYFLPAFLFHLFYVPLISLASVFTKKVEWK